MWWYLFSLGRLKNNFNTLILITNFIIIFIRKVLVKRFLYKISYESSWSSILAYDYWEISIEDKTSS